MKKHIMTTRVMIIMGAVCAAGTLQADSFHFGFGVTPYGNSLSIGYGHRVARPKPPRRRVRIAPPPRRFRYAPPPPPRVVYRRSAGHYETRVERVWVEGYWRRVNGRRGSITSVWIPGYWSEKTIRVWVRH